MSTTRRAAIARSNSRAAQEDRERLQGQPGTKVCTRCRAPKPLEAFGEDRRHADGRKSRCQVCHALEVAEHARTKEGRAARWAYYSRPEVKAARRDAQLRYLASPKGQAWMVRYRSSVRFRLLAARQKARERLALTGSPRTAATLAALEAEIARIDRQREIA